MSNSDALSIFREERSSPVLGGDEQGAGLLDCRRLLELLPGGDQRHLAGGGGGPAGPHHQPPALLNHGHGYILLHLGTEIVLVSRFTKSRNHVPNGDITSERMDKWIDTI